MNAGSSENKTPYNYFACCYFFLTPFSPFSYLWGEVENIMKCIDIFCSCYDLFLKL